MLDLATHAGVVKIPTLKFSLSLSMLDGRRNGGFS